MQRLLGTNDPIWRRADGKPLGANGHSVSAAHAGDFTLAVAGHVKLGCDLESVTSRTEDVWSALLGGDQMLLAKRIAQERNESLDTAATRLWAARESLKKAGQSVTAPLVLDSTGAREWVLLRSGAMTICTCLAAVRGTPGPLVAAVAIKST
jgi:enediyne polyketide synthase